MPAVEPFHFGPFSVDSSGRLSPGPAESSPGFSIAWRGRVVHARLDRDGGGRGSLSLRATLGQVPSTVADPDSRAACFDALRGLGRVLPDGWTVRLMPDHRPRLETALPVALPITVTDLVTELTVFLFDLAPCLDAMEQAGFAGAGEAARH